MYPKDDKDEQNNKSFFHKVLTVRGVSIILIGLIVVYAIIYYADICQSGIIKNFVRIARYELIFLIYLGVVAVIVIRFIQIIANILDKKTSSGNYAVSAILLPIYFMLVIESFSYSLNDVMDLLSSGQPFAIIILILVLGSVLMICVLSIEIIFSRKSEYANKKANEVADSVTDVATELIGSFVRLVKFVTVDYLVEVKDMVCGSEDTEANDSDREGDSHETQEQNGGASRTDTGNKSGKEFGERNESNRSAGTQGGQTIKRN